MSDVYNKIFSLTNRYAPVKKDFKFDKKPEMSFEAVLNEKLLRESRVQNVKISKHAQMRLVQRDITIDNFISDKINSIVDKEKLKGSKDILIMSDETAYIVNVPNKTMITVMSKEELKENIFTNIDAVAII